MKDIQSQADHRRINIKKVGVKEVAYPITVLDKARSVQRTVANVNMYVNLPHLFKGTHMSRFVEILNKFHGQVDLKSFRVILEEMKDRLDAQAAHVEMEFPYFLKRGAGHGNGISMAEYDCRMHASLESEERLIMEVRVPITATIPAHEGDGLPRYPGRWGYANIRLRFKHFVWLEDLIQMVEDVLSGKVRINTGEAGGSESRLSVEGVTKDLGEMLSRHPDIRWFSIMVENLAEGYSTFASLEWPEEEEEGY